MNAVSPRMARAVSAELVRLERSLERADRRVARAREALEVVERDRASIQASVDWLRRIDPDADPTPPAYRAPAGAIGGRDLRIAAVRVALDAFGPERPFCVLQLLARLADAGVAIVGSDPTNVLRTNLHRSPVVMVMRRTGRYAVDTGAPDRLAGDVRAASRFLSDCPVAELPQRAAAVIRAERRLSEARDSLGLA